MCKEIVEAPEVKYCGAKQSLARAVNLSSKLHKKQLQLFPVKSWPLEPGHCSHLMLLFVAALGLSCYVLCGMDNP